MPKQAPATWDINEIHKVPVKINDAPPLWMQMTAKECGVLGVILLVGIGLGFSFSDGIGGIVAFVLTIVTMFVVGMMFFISHFKPKKMYTHYLQYIMKAMTRPERFCGDAWNTVMGAPRGYVIPKALQVLRENENKHTSNTKKKK